MHVLGLSVRQTLPQRAQIERVRMLEPGDLTQHTHEDWTAVCAGLNTIEVHLHLAGKSLYKCTGSVRAATVCCCALHVMKASFSLYGHVHTAGVTTAFKCGSESRK